MQLHAAAVLGNPQVRENRQELHKREIASQAMALAMWMDEHLTTRGKR